MKKTLLAAALSLTCGLALAHGCPNEMKAIDAKLATGVKLAGRVADIAFAGPAPQRQEAPPPPPPKPAPKPAPTGSGFDGMDDDIPF